MIAGRSKGPRSPVCIYNHSHAFPSSLILGATFRMRRIASTLLFFFVAVATVCMAQTGTQASNSGTRTDDAKRAYKTAMEDADQKIAAEVKEHSEMMKNLEYLCYHIGARLTGSPQMQAASAWTLQRFKDYGVDAH